MIRRARDGRDGGTWVTRGLRAACLGAILLSCHEDGPIEAARLQPLRGTRRRQGATPHDGSQPTAHGRDLPGPGVRHLDHAHHGREHGRGRERGHQAAVLDDARLERGREPADPVAPRPRARALPGRRALSPPAGLALRSPTDIEQVLWDPSDPALLYYPSNDNAEPLLIEHRVRPTESWRVLHDFRKPPTNCPVDWGRLLRLGSDPQWMSWGPRRIIGLSCGDAKFLYSITEDAVLAVGHARRPTPPWPLRRRPSPCWTAASSAWGSCRCASS